MRDITNTLLCLLKRQLLRMVVVRVVVTAEVTETCRERGVRSLGGLRKSLCRKFQVLQVFLWRLGVLGGMEDGNGASVHGYSTMVSRCVRGVEKIYEDGMAFCLLSR